MLCPLKFSHYEFEGGQDCIGTECGMHNLCNADNEITAVEFDALDEHAQALERENEELRKLCGANDALAAGNGVSEASMDANDGSELQDSREKLEVDVITTFGDGLVRSIIMRLLDRQAAITERDLCRQCSWPSLAAMPDKEAYDRIAELQAKVDELTEDYKASSNGLEILTLKNAELQTQVNNLNSENAKLSSDELHLRNALAQSEHELATLRDKLGRMLDNAHEITRIGGDC